MLYKKYTLKKAGGKLSNNILVIGDSILDHDTFCTAIGLSLETPTLKSKFLGERFVFGGASNVVNNILALKNNVTYLTALADDSFHEQYKNWNNDYLQVEILPYKGQNLVKSRYWIKKGSKNYKYLQINKGTKCKTTELIDYTKKVISIKTYQTVILVDYNNGIFEDKKEVQELIQLLKENGMKVISSSQKSDRESRYKIFENSDLICMNEDEAAATLKGFELSKEKMAELSEFLNSDICVTCGANGSYYYSEELLVRSSSFTVKAVDTCGAGDAFLASFSVTKDLNFANKWAAISVTKIGTQVPTMEEYNDM